jgi:hypothetical protein
VNLGETALQLDELRFAVRSPVGRAEEDDHRAFRTQERLQRVGLTVLIAKAEIGQVGTDLRADAFNVDFRVETARLGLTSVADADREQGKAEDENVSSSAEPVAHAGTVLSWR